MSIDRHEIHVVPPLRSEPLGPSRICIVADGNTRHGGHRGGKSATIALAEHCARRGDVERLVVCVLSAENIARRGDALFATLEQLFLELGVEIATRGVLVRAGVRCGIYGDLGPLRARGGPAARLAAMLEAVVARTASVTSWRTELLFAVGYPASITQELDLHAVIRTGMEEQRGRGVIRLSGIDAHCGVVCLGSTTLYPDFGPDRLDDALSVVRAAGVPAFAPGFSLGVVADLIAKVEATDLGPVRLTLPVIAPPAELDALLGRLQYEGLGDRAAVGVEHAFAPGEPPRRYGPPWETAREIVLLSPAAQGPQHRAAPPAAMIAAGQRGPAFLLPGSPRPRHANVFGAGATAAGIVEGVRGALRFAGAHPALLGADRPAASGIAPEPDEPWPRSFAARLAWLEAHPGASVDELAMIGDEDARDALAGACAARMLHEARARGLTPARRGVLRAVYNYLLNAVIMTYRVAREDDPRGERWVEVARHASTFMTAVALGDEEVFDRQVPEMSAGERRAWSMGVARYLGAAARDREAACPGGPATQEIEAIARLWRETHARLGETAHPAVLAGWSGALGDLYGANVAELDPAAEYAPLLSALRQVGHPRRAAVTAIAARYASGARTDLAARRVRELLDAVASTPETLATTADELAVWMFLEHTGPSIAAGALFRHVALLWPAALVTEEMASGLDRAAGLIDLYFRLANDVSALRGEDGLDRDDKPNAWTQLVPEGALGAGAAGATIEATALCLAVKSRIGRELGRALAELDRVWPTLARYVRRGIHVGALVYQGGHYATASPAFMREVFSRVEEADRAPRPPEQRGEEMALPDDGSTGAALSP